MNIVLSPSRSVGRNSLPVPGGGRPARFVLWLDVISYRQKCQKSRRRNGLAGRPRRGRKNFDCDAGCVESECVIGPTGAVWMMVAALHVDFRKVPGNQREEVGLGPGFRHIPVTRDFSQAKACRTITERSSSSGFQPNRTN
jgi:hypothetical protein